MCNGKAPTKKGVEGVKLKKSFQKAAIPEDLKITAPKHKLQVVSCCNLSSLFSKKGKLLSFVFILHNYKSYRLTYKLHVWPRESL